MMNPDIPTRYNPEKIEEKWYDFWQRQGLFHAEMSGMFLEKTKSFIL